MFTGVLFPISIVNLINDLQVATDTSMYELRMLLAFVSPLVSLAAMILGFLLLGSNFQANRGVFSGWINDVKQWLSNSSYFPFPSLHGFYVVLIELYFICVFLRRSFGFNCHENISNSSWIELFGGGKCFEHDIVRQFIASNAFLMFLFPALLFACLPGTPIMWIWSSLSLAVIIYILAVVFLQATSGIIMMLLWLIVSAFAIRNIQCRNLTIYFMNVELKRLMKEKERLQDEQHANELRGFVANVAHDLKTVS